jgi:hypothetical protein
MKARLKKLWRAVKMTTEKAISVVLNSKNMEKAANVVGLFLIGGGIGSVIIGIGLMHTAPKLA